MTRHAAMRDAEITRIRMLSRQRDKLLSSPPPWLAILIIVAILVALAALIPLWNNIEQGPGLHSGGYAAYRGDALRIGNPQPTAT